MDINTLLRTYITLCDSIYEVNESSALSFTLLARENIILMNNIDRSIVNYNNIDKLIIREPDNNTKAKRFIETFIKYLSDHNIFIDIDKNLAIKNLSLMISYKLNSMKYYYLVDYMDNLRVIGYKLLLSLINNNEICEDFLFSKYFNDMFYDYTFLYDYNLAHLKERTYLRICYKNHIMAIFYQNNYIISDYEFFYIKIFLFQHIPTYYKDKNDNPYLVNYSNSPKVMDVFNYFFDLGKKEFVLQKKQTDNKKYLYVNLFSDKILFITNDSYIRISNEDIYHLYGSVVAQYKEQYFNKIIEHYQH